MTLPPNVTTAIRNRDFTIATIAGAKADEEVKPATAAAPGAEGAAAPAAEGEAAKADDKAAAKPAEKGGKK